MTPARRRGVVERARPDTYLAFFFFFFVGLVAARLFSRLLGGLLRLCLLGRRLCSRLLGFLRCRRSSFGFGSLLDFGFFGLCLSWSSAFLALAFLAFLALLGFGFNGLLGFGRSSWPPRLSWLLPALLASSASVAFTVFLALTFLAGLPTVTLSGPACSGGSLHRLLVSTCCGSINPTGSAGSSTASAGFSPSASAFHSRKACASRGETSGYSASSPTVGRIFHDRAHLVPTAFSTTTATPGTSRERERAGRRVVVGHHRVRGDADFGQIDIEQRVEDRRCPTHRPAARPPATSRCSWRRVRVPARR